MTDGKIILYLITMVIVVNSIRILPVTLIRGKIKNRFVRSFLYYVPYVTLAVMTFPAITEATSVPVAGWTALLVGIVAAWRGMGLFPVAVICSSVVFVMELLIHLSQV